MISFIFIYLVLIIFIQLVINICFFIERMHLNELLRGDRDVK